MREPVTGGGVLVRPPVTVARPRPVQPSLLWTDIPVGVVVYRSVAIRPVSAARSREVAMAPKPVRARSWPIPVSRVEGREGDPAAGSCVPALQGPQVTLYCPAPLLRAGGNTVTVLELERLGGELELRDRPEPGAPEEYVEEFERPE
ncbi:hypothetical protein [Streptomyces europaeiscabiei]|uniref:hypothetical protein n=1 Tax=Streptomyces europaeiscabiei TaxID=146819 RepID=UPI0029BBD182|nr:hypothetical protein [Streptomyces europaeiscabiei]MDX3843333.1 hypothetical protein [Streptomyces europaeiscabiei]